MRLCSKIACALLLPLATACAASDNGNGDAAASSGSITLASYNLALAFGYIEEAPARVDPLIEALSNLDADVICLQELWVTQNDAGMWTSDVIERVLAGTSGNYPYQHWSRTGVAEDVAEIGCTVAEAEPLEACALDKCGDVDPNNIADCILADCPTEFEATAADCQSCLAAQLGQPLASIIASCKGVTASGIVYNGHNGLAILSKLPLSETSITELNYALTARAVLGATVTGEGDNQVDLYCTHIAADLEDEIAYPEGGTYTSFGEENAAQVDAILALTEGASAETTIALMGDFNHGPAIGAGQAELLSTYQMILDAGYADPAADAGIPCTFCDANSLNLGAGAGGKLIDHVYVKTPGTVVDGALFLDEGVALTTADGTEQTTNLSDHYGISASVDF